MTIRQITDRATDLDSTAHLLGVEPDSLRGGLNLVEAAGVLGIAPSTLRRQALDGKIGHMRIGRSWRFAWFDLADFLARNHRPAGRESERPEPHQKVRAGRARPDAQIEAEARSFGLI